MNEKYNPIEYLRKLEEEFTNEMLDDTLHYQKQYSFNIGEDELAHNNESDAFRHAYMQSLLAQRYTPNLGKMFSNIHEIQGNIDNQDPREANMDMWNNRQGQEIYEEICKEYPLFSELPQNRQKDIIAQKVVQRMRESKLITGLNDTRKLQGYTNPLTGNNRIFTREYVRNMTPAEFSKFEKKLMHN